LYPFRDIVTVIKWGRLRCAGHYGCGTGNKKCKQNSGD